MSTASLVWYQIDAQFNSVAKSLGKEEEMTSTGTSLDSSERVSPAVLGWTALDPVSGGNFTALEWKL